MDRKLLVVAWGVLLAWGVSPLAAQEGPLTAMYGKGVHLYFSGQMFPAHEAFTAAIEGGSADPRVYFYRGLNYLRLQRQREAFADFTRGAALEAAAPGPPFDVSRALTRIQGGARIAIERARQKARLDAAVAAQAEQRQRYEEMRTEPSILTPPAAAPAAQPAAAGSTPPPASNDPFAEPAASPPVAAPAPAENPPAAPPPTVEAPPAETPAAPATPPVPATDPFAPPPKAADPPAERP